MYTLMDDLDDLVEHLELNPVFPRVGPIVDANFESIYSKLAAEARSGREGTRPPQSEQPGRCLRGPPKLRADVLFFQRTRSFRTKSESANTEYRNLLYWYSDTRS